jgi:hypothetical protein
MNIVHTICKVHFALNTLVSDVLMTYLMKICNVIEVIKGSLTQDFRLQVLLEISVPRAPEYPIRTISKFSENSRRYSRMNVYQQCQRHRRKKKKF